MPDGMVRVREDGVVRVCGVRGCGTRGALALDVVVRVIEDGVVGVFT